MNQAPKIDFIVTWVDGGDPQWRREKQRWLNGGELPQNTPESMDVRDVRYRDWDNLRYWFRAVETYAPWVNKIHFVTCGHLPPWLNTDAPKLNVVKHSDYIPEEYLPTFCSRPIEFNFHRIQELSEHFVLFNDDFFLTAPVSPEDFFVDGLPCDSIREDPIGFYKREMYNSTLVNDLVFVNQHFKRKEVRRKLRSKWFSLRSPNDMVRNLITSLLGHERFFGLCSHHLPQAYLKKHFAAFWELEPELMHQTSSHKFRDARDISHHCIKYWQMLSGNFHPYDKHRHGKLFSVDCPDQVCDAIRNKRYKFICINDSDQVDFEPTKEKLNGAFQEVFPNKSSFER